MTAKNKPNPREQELQRQNEELRLRLEEAEETLRAIREGEVDAVVVSGSKGEQVFSLVGAESIYRLIVETMREAAFTVSFDGTILFCNSRFGEFLQRPMEYILGRRLQDFVDPAERGTADTLLAAVQEQPVSQRLVFSDADGVAVPAYVSANILNQPDSRSICVVAADLTELENSTKLVQQLRRQQDELRQQRAQLESILMYLPVGVIIAEAPSGKIIISNERVKQIWRQESLPSDSIERYDMYKAFHPDGRSYLPHEWPLARTISTGEQILHEEIEFQREDGSHGWMTVNSAPILDAEGKIAMGLVTFSDISRRKHAEEELHRLNEELEQRVVDRTVEIQQQADRLRTLAGILSRTEQRERKHLAKILHDHVQQLIVAAQMQLGYARHARDIGPEEVQEAIQTATAVLSEAMEASRSLAIDLCPPILHESGLISALSWLADRTQSSHRLNVKFHAQREAEPVTEEIRFLLFECAQELLLNTVKHAGAKDAFMELVRTEGDKIKLNIRDEGKGFNFKSINTSSSQNTTFGLFNIQQRLADVGGRMEIESTLGKGTAVTLTVPDSGEKPLAIQGPEAIRDQDGAGTAAPPAGLGLCRVLIVDDHEVVREGLIRIIGNNPDIEVVGEAGDGLQAIELAERLKPDVVLMDVSLGEMSGIEATRQILKSNPSVKVVGLSARNDMELALAMRSAGASAYLDKAGNSDALINTIRSCAKTA